MLSNQLGALESSGLVKLATTLPEVEYLFRHALLQESAYSSLLKQERKRLHLAVGETLERLYAERKNELAPLLGQHFYESEDVRALDYLLVAGDSAAAKYANVEAIDYYSRALVVAKRYLSNETSASQIFTRLYISYGTVFELSGRYDEALRIYEDMEELALTRRDQVLTLGALTARVTLHCTHTPKYDPAQGQALCARALALARELKDYEAEAKTLWALMLLNHSIGFPRTAIEYGEQSLEITRNRPFLQQHARTLNGISRSYLVVGQIDRALATLQEARPIWQVLDNRPMLAECLSNSAACRLFSGFYQDTMDLAQEAYVIATSVGNPYGQSFSRMIACYAHLERGDLSDSIKTMEDSIGLGKEGGFIYPSVGIRSILAWLYGTLGAVDRGMKLAELAYATAMEQLPLWRPWALAVVIRLHLMQGNLRAAQATAAIAAESAETLIKLRVEGGSFGYVFLQLALGELALAQGDHQRAISTMDELVTNLRNANVRPFLTDAMLLKGRVFVTLGRLDEAGVVLSEARLEAEQLGAKRTLWQILHLLAVVEFQRSDSDRGVSLRNEAHRSLQYVINHINDPNLQNSFLSTQPVRSVMEAL